MVLAQHCNDVEINVYEAKTSFTEIGAGVSLWNRTLAILQSLGLDDAVGRAVGKMPVKKMGKSTSAFETQLVLMTRKNPRIATERVIRK